MAIGDIEAKYGTAVAMAVTNLHSIATSTTRVAGWSGAVVDSSATPALDFQLSASIKVASSGLAAGQIDLRVYSHFATMSAGVPDLFSAGTEGSQAVATVHSENQRESGMKLHGSAATSTTASALYHIALTGIARLFGGFPPPFWAPFISHSTGANLAADTNRVDYIPVLAKYS